MSDGRLEEILEYNAKFVKDAKYEIFCNNKIPAKRVVILSCMDTRLTELLPQAMNIKNGDAKIVKNAGATIVHPFGSIMRSIIVAIYEFDVDDVFIIGHKGCGMSSLDPDAMIKKIKDRGISDSIISTLFHSGINVKDWLKGFGSVEDAIKESVFMTKNHPLVPKGVRIHGLLMDSDTGELEVIVKGE